MVEVRTFIEKIVPISDDDWNYFSSKLIKKDFKRRSFLLERGVVEKFLFFISKGVVRLYVPGVGNDTTFGFMFENEFVTGYDSFLTQRPSEYQIQALTDTSTWRISFSDLQKVYDHTEIGNVIGRKMAESMYLRKSKRELSLLNQTAEERYLEIFTERPELMQHIPMKYIASYVGVTPQGLSRIRRRIP